MRLRQLLLLQKPAMVRMGGEVPALGGSHQSTEDAAIRTEAWFWGKESSTQPGSWAELPDASWLLSVSEKVASSECTVQMTNACLPVPLLAVLDAHLAVLNKHHNFGGGVSTNMLYNWTCRTEFGAAFAL